MTLEWCWPWIAALLLAIGAVRTLTAYAAEWGLVDQANERSLHTGSKPRSGGLGMLVAIGCGWVLAALTGYTFEHLAALCLAGLAVAGISLLDDFRDVPQVPRFAVHLLAAATPIVAGFALRDLVLPGFSLPLGAIAGAILTVLFVVWFINLYNFMDGMDGFAGGMTLFGFGFFAVLGVIQDAAGFALASAVVAASAAGFLVFNFPPAKVFMGDAGAATLGFLAAGFILWADSAGIAPLWIGVMIFAPFFLDATVTLFRRAWRGERIWEAHRTHYYQRLVQAGWSHRRAVLLEYALMIGCGGSAVWVVNDAPWLQWGVILLWLGVFVISAAAVHAYERPRA